MISLMIDQFKTELHWLERIERELPKRSKAKNPEFAGGQQR